MGLSSDVFFCLHVGGPTTGGAYKRQFTVLPYTGIRITLHAAMRTKMCIPGLSNRLLSESHDQKQ